MNKEEKEEEEDFIFHKARNIRTRTPQHNYTTRIVTFVTALVYRPLAVITLQTGLKKTSKMLSPIGDTWCGMPPPPMAVNRWQMSRKSEKSTSVNSGH